jgi:site-specific DNA-methyltransferase (adenine-specific)
MYNRKKQHVVKGYQEPIKETYYDFTKSWLEQCYRVLKPDGSGWICSGWSNLGDVLQAIKDCNFKVVNHVIWKYQFGVYTKRKFVTSHYHMLFVAKKDSWDFNKDCRYTDIRNKSGNENYRDRQDVWEIDRPYNYGETKNANTQPPELVKKALMYTTKENDLILDCFMGGATTAIACIYLNRHFIGFELNENLKPLHEKRISLAQNEMRLC